MIEGFIVACAWLVWFLALLGGVLVIQHLFALARAMFGDRTGNSGRQGHWWDGKEHD